MSVAPIRQLKQKHGFQPFEQDFSYTGSVETFTVPSSGLYMLEAWGCEGNGAGGAGGGKGGYSKGYIKLTRGQKLYVCCGGIAYNGGQNAGDGGSQYPMAASGGATHIAKVTGVLSAIGKTDFIDNGNGLIVAGGGGGGAVGKNVEPYRYNKGGDGGGLEGERSRANGGEYYGTAATQSAGGTGYDGAGSFGTGGYSNHGAGGGGGLYGGASGGYSISGGGGSGYIGGTPTITYQGHTYTASMTSGNNSGNGKAKITRIA